MNLSQRLDQARQQRTVGAVADRGPTNFDLRMTRDERIYDGRHVRTGEELTGDRWQELRSPGDPADDGLPAWNPKRANEEVLGAWEADLPMVTGLATASPAAPSVSAPPRSEALPSPSPWPTSTTSSGASTERQADVIDLRSPVDPLRPPASTLEPSADARPGTCPSCSGHSRLVRLDLLENHAELRCDECGFRFSDRAAAYAPKGR